MFALKTALLLNSPIFQKRQTGSRAKILRLLTPSQMPQVFSTPRKFRETEEFQPLRKRVQHSFAVVEILLFREICEVCWKLVAFEKVSTDGGFLFEILFVSSGKWGNSGEGLSLERVTGTECTARDPTECKNPPSLVKEAHFLSLFQREFPLVSNTTPGAENQLFNPTSFHWDETLSCQRKVLLERCRLKMLLFSTGGVDSN